jgi:hypothetical protein
MMMLIYWGKYNNYKGREKSNTLNTSKEVRLGAWAEKNEYMLMSRHHNQENEDVYYILWKCGIVEYVETTVTNQNCIHK